MNAINVAIVGKVGKMRSPLLALNVRTQGGIDEEIF